jgi:tRNA dimethylallyltransferase
VNGNNNGGLSRLLLVIVGPTAVGKTELSLKMANEFTGEIISADSRLFYQGMDIGTDKPSFKIRAHVPHHMIDICRPDETITLGHYLRSARVIINNVQNKGRLPILVGGTGQYVRAITEGWTVPEVAPLPTLRDQLDRLDDQELFRWLSCLDPASASKIDQRNRRRIIRALEVTLITGYPMSFLQRKVSPGYDCKIIGLTCDREVLYRRIDERVEKMMAGGFLAEVESLRKSGYRRELPAMSGLGYRQLLAYLDGENTLDEAIERIKFETHRFARQQYNWFRIDNHEIDWFDVQESDWSDLIQYAVTDWLQ